MKILIASPSHNGDVRIEYMRSIMDTMFFLTKRRIDVSILVEQGSEIHKMRSVMGSVVVNDPTFTHILFVDTDIGFKPSAVQRMVAAQKDVIGCAYPYRTVPWHSKPTGSTILSSIAESVPYAATPIGSVNKEGICAASRIGTGLLLIKRSALVAIAESSVVRKYKTHFPYTNFYKHEFYYGLFDHLEDGGYLLGEDHSFCKRWIELCGGEIFALMDEETTHTGPIPIVGNPKRP